MKRNGSDPTTSLVECVRQARAGDASSWKRIESEIRRTVFARLQLPVQLDPEEVLNDTLSELWRAFHTLRDDDKLLSFATTVARRVAARMKRQRSPLLPLRSEPEVRGSELAQRNVEGEELLRSISHSLKEADRQLFRLLYVVGATSKEVQSDLGISPTLLRQRKHRLHKRLREVTSPDPESRDRGAGNG